MRKHQMSFVVCALGYILVIQGVSGLAVPSRYYPGHSGGPVGYTGASLEASVVALPGVCANNVDCNNGLCVNGQCVCFQGYSGRTCLEDNDACSDTCCYPGVTCYDEPAPSPGYRCGPCPQGFTGDGRTCTMIAREGSCREDVECTNGLCRSGQCVCFQGWTGPNCLEDRNGCVDGCCYPGVACYDLPPPSPAFTCGPCPEGLTGDGKNCTVAVQQPEPAIEPEPRQMPACLSDSCGGVPDGNYRWCHGCHLFVMCSNEAIHYQTCPAGLVWDSNTETCEWWTATCTIQNPCGCAYGECDQSTLTCSCLPGYQGQHCEPAPASAEPVPPSTVDCVSDSCAGVPDGNHRWCHGCHLFVMCSNGLTNYQTCPAGLVWDSDTQACAWWSASCSVQDPCGCQYGYCDESNTCVCVPGWGGDSCGTAAPRIIEPAPSVFDARECIMSCDGLSDGDYQLCHKCDHFASCSNGQLYEMPCAPEGLVWDDTTRRCEWTSTTCDVQTPEICQCVNGLCDEATGECSLCLSGWQGPYCDQDIDGCDCPCCYPGVECQDVVAPGTGFTCGDCPAPLVGDGIVCEMAACECVHGQCNDDGSCECQSGWAGELCDLDIDGCADNPCYAGVTCYDVAAPGVGHTCGTCPPNHSGDGTTCKCDCVNGNCSDTGVCECMPGWEGALCDLDICKCVNGLCNRTTGYCSVCLSGWEGDLCDKDIDGCNCTCCDPRAGCYDKPAPETGYQCGTCPPPLVGNGKFCYNPLEVDVPHNSEGREDHSEWSIYPYASSSYGSSSYYPYDDENYNPYAQGSYANYL